MKFIDMCATEQTIFRALVAGVVALAVSGCGKEEPKPAPAPAPKPAPAPAPKAVTPPPPVAAPQPPATPRADVNKDGYVSKAEKVDFRQEFEADFRAADKNYDGGISRDELAQAKGLKRLGSIRNYFAAMDTDNDGKVTVVERDAWHRAYGELTKK